MGEEQEVILLDFYPSMFGQRLRIALSEKQIKYEYREENIRKGKSPFLLEVNPVHKKVPVLIHNGKPVCESLIAVQYIDDVWNTKAPLMPSHPYHKSQALFWADLIDKKVYDLGSRIWKTKGEEQDLIRKELIHIFKLLEGELGEKPFFGGETFGFLDIALISYYSWFSAYESFGKFSIEKECPKLIEWVKRCLLKQSVSKSIADPQKVYEFVADLRKYYGLD